jgi:hypothetical protein
MMTLQRIVRLAPKAELTAIAKMFAAGALRGYSVHEVGVVTALYYGLLFSFPALEIDDQLVSLETSELYDRIRAGDGARLL